MAPINTQLRWSHLLVRYKSSLQRNGRKQQTYYPVIFVGQEFRQGKV